MHVHVPAMRGKMGSRTYYACLMPLEAIQSMFKFDPEERQWLDLSPEQREQRVLNKGRLPVITSYILENEDDYLFASITASYKSEPVFIPSSMSEGEGNIGLLKLKLGDELTINAGQHRCGAIVEAVKKHHLRPAISLGEYGPGAADVHRPEPPCREDLEVDGRADGQPGPDFHRDQVRPGQDTGLQGADGEARHEPQGEEYQDFHAGGAL